MDPSYRKYMRQNLEARLKGTDLKLTLEEVEGLTHEQAVAVLIGARRCLLDHLLIQETHLHMEDDCGDYLNGATQNWVRLFEAYFDVGGEEEFVQAVREFLLESPEDWEACDGDVRYDILPEDYIESSRESRGS